MMLTCGTSNWREPPLHLLQGGLMHVLGAGNLYRRWIFYHGGVRSWCVRLSACEHAAVRG